MPATIGLSITSLASWCLQDDWIADLPLDEAVPMLYRMGADGRTVRAHLESGKDFRPALCRRSLGVSTDEPPLRIPKDRRVYVFHPGGWSPDVLDRILREERP